MLAGPEGIAAYETALERVEAELATDPDDAAILEALHDLVAGIPAESPVTCERVGDVPDTSGITLRTLIAAPVEHPSLSGTNDEGAGAIPVTYDSGGLTISARLSLPAGSGPFPAVVLVQPFGGLEREAERLVHAGYVVLETDLRGHGNSDPDPSQATDLEMGSTLDVVNAARALAIEPRVDASRIALVGAGLGGLIVINAEVVAPEVAAAVIAKNPSSIDVWQNIEYYLEPDDEARALIVDSRGTPDDNPMLWADLSPATFADRIDSPLLILQGTGDTGNDPSWSDATARLHRRRQGSRGHHVRGSRLRPRPVMGGRDRGHRGIPRQHPLMVSATRNQQALNLMFGSARTAFRRVWWQHAGCPCPVRRRC